MGLVSDFLNDHTTRYPSVFLQDLGGNISLSGHATTLNYKMFFLDLVHVSDKQNEQDVQSDMVSIAMDLLAQMNSSTYNDWKISTSNSLQLLVENESDMLAGCTVDFSVSIMYDQNICAAPSDLVISGINQIDNKVYNVTYIATGAEGSTLTVPEISGKNILLATREDNIIYKVSNNPDEAEFTVSGMTITLGLPVSGLPGERFLFVYTNY